MYDEPSTDDKVCDLTNGLLPGDCGNLAFPYIAFQPDNPKMYDNKKALYNGTLFPGLRLPFFKEMRNKYALENTALVELMALSFSVDELGLYLTTHRYDKEALELYWKYVEMLKQGEEKYRSMYGPLQITDYSKDGFAWLDNPWPWDIEGVEA